MAVVAIDNDECIGSWSDISILHHFIVHECKQKPSIPMFIAIMKKSGCFRPGLRKFYDTLLMLKQKRKVSKIFMCTAAKGKSGWVHFLKKVVEAWYGRHIYDGVIFNEMIKDWHEENGTSFTDKFGCVYKDMNMVRKMAKARTNEIVIAIDDKPTYIMNGFAIPTKPYYADVDLIKEGLQFLTFPSEKHQKYYISYIESYGKGAHPKQVSNSKNDTDLLSTSHILNSYFA